MYNEFCEKYKKAVMRDAEDSICKANEGLLCPHLYVRTRTELQSVLCEDISGKEIIRSLVNRLDEAVQARAQISDLEWEQHNISPWGEFIFYFPSEDYWTSMEIIKVSKPGAEYSFAASVFIDKEASSDNLMGYAEKMRSELERWVTDQGIEISAKNDDVDFEEQTHFQSLENAVEYLLDALNHPDMILC